MTTNVENIISDVDELMSTNPEYENNKFSELIKIVKNKYPNKDVLNIITSTYFNKSVETFEVCNILPSTNQTKINILYYTFVFICVLVQILLYYLSWIDRSSNIFQDVQVGCDWYSQYI